MTTTHQVDLVEQPTVENIVRAAFFAALIGACAYVAFPNPFSPVPVTLQVLAVFLAGILLGPRWGTLSLVLYIAAGALGAPVFSQGNAGINHLFFSQTTGFIWSFPVAAFTIGFITHNGMQVKPLDQVSIPRLVGALLNGTLIIYAFGIIGLILILALSLASAILVGAVPFLPFEGAKIIAAIGIVRNDLIRAQ
jgi:biotin transport system substrate-specific component